MTQQKINIADKAPGQQLTAAELNSIKNVVDANSDDIEPRVAGLSVFTGFNSVNGDANALNLFNVGNGSTILYNDGNYGFEWYTDETDSKNLTATSKMDLTAEGELNTLCQKVTHTATQADEHALEIIADAAGFGDVKALDIDYITGAIGAGEDEGIILVNIDETLATGGEVFGLEVLTTTIGGDAIIAVKTGVGVDPISQDSGIFEDITKILNKTVEVQDALTIAGGGNIAIFVADNDTLTVGHTTKFAELETILGTGASQNVQPTWEYSAAGSTWLPFTPTDGTNGFQNTGAMLWDSNDLTGWVTFGATGEYQIRITRTRNGLNTPPIVDTMQFADPDIFSWDKDGAVKIDTLEIVSLIAYDDDADAFNTGGLTTGQTYQTNGNGAAPLNVAGIVMVKQ